MATELVEIVGELLERLCRLWCVLRSATASIVVVDDRVIGLERSQSQRQGVMDVRGTAVTRD